MEYYPALKTKDILQHRAHYAKWNKPDTKDQILFDSTYELPRIGKFLSAWEYT